MKQITRFLAILIMFGLAACSSRTPEITGERKQPVQNEQQAGRKIVVEDKTAADKSSQPSAEMVKIALILPLTGGGSDLGQAMLNSVMLAYSNMPQTSGGKKVIFIVKDTGSMPDGAVKALQGAMEEGAEMVLGPVFSRELEAILPQLARNGVAAVSFSNNKQLFGQGAYITGFMPDQQVARILEHAQDSGKRSVACLLPNDAYGQLIADEVRKFFATSTSMKLHEIVFYPPGARDLSLELSRLKGYDVKDASAYISPGFDALFLPEGGSRLANFRQMISAYKINLADVTILGSGQWQDGDGITGAELEGARYVGTDPQKLREFQAFYSTAYGSKPPRVASLAYDSATLLLNLAAKGYGAREMDSAMRSSAGFIGPVDGLFRLNDSGIGERGLAVLEVDANGSSRVVDPQPQAFNDSPGIRN